MISSSRCGGRLLLERMTVERIGLAVTEGGPTIDDAFEWTESRYDTSVALVRARQLRDGGFALRCVWSAS